MIQRVSVGQMCAELLTGLRVIQCIQHYPPFKLLRSLGCPLDSIQFITIYNLLISQWTLLQVWSLNQDNELKVDRLLCLEVTRHEMLKVMKCHGQGGAQEWRHNKVRTLSFTMMKNMAFKLQAVNDQAVVCLDKKYYLKGSESPVRICMVAPIIQIRALGWIVQSCRLQIIQDQ